MLTYIIFSDNNPLLCGSAISSIRSFFQTQEDVSFVVIATANTESIRAAYNQLVVDSNDYSLKLNLITKTTWKTRSALRYKNRFSLLRQSCSESSTLRNELLIELSQYNEDDVVLLMTDQDVIIKPLILHKELVHLLKAGKTRTSFHLNVAMATNSKPVCLRDQARYITWDSTKTTHRFWQPQLNIHGGLYNATSLLDVVKKIGFHNTDSFVYHASQYIQKHKLFSRHYAMHKQRLVHVECTHEFQDYYQSHNLDSVSLSAVYIQIPFNIIAPSVAPQQITILPSKQIVSQAETISLHSYSPSIGMIHSTKYSTISQNILRTEKHIT